MKDALLNLLVFLLVFVATAALFLGTYALALLLVPGGKGLIFANPYAAALIPSLVTALLVASYRSVRRPGSFRVTWALLAGAFFLLLTLPLPILRQMPPLRAADASPLLPGRFLALEDGTLLLSSGPASVAIPPGEDLMDVSQNTQFDPLHQRFVFSHWEPKELGTTGPEQQYYQFTPAWASLQTDVFALYSVLRDSQAQAPFVFWFQAWAVTWLFMGVYLFFSWKTWPLVHILLILLLARLGLAFLVYAFWSVPALADLWLDGVWAGWARTWGPIVLVDTAAAALFFMTWLSKPHRRMALS